MTIFVLAFLAGVLTVAAPCILPVIPVILGGSLAREPHARPSMRRPIVVVVSLAVSIVVFTLLLKTSTLLLGVPTQVLRYISGGIIVLFGCNLIWPQLWERVALFFGLQPKTMKVLAKSQQSQGLGGDILLGAALGPVFSSCSPTYALIVALVLPHSLAAGTAYLVAYALGLCSTLLMAVYLGRALVQKLGWLTRPGGMFIRSVGVLLVITGVMILWGADKTVQTYILDQGWYAPIERIEESLIGR